jgi:hypothetical protein
MARDRILAEIARKGGGKLLDAAIDKVLPAAPAVEVETSPRKRTLLGGVATAMAVRIATRSVPGAIVVGGAAVAKRLYDRRRAKTAKKAPPKA